MKNGTAPVEMFQQSRIDVQDKADFQVKKIRQLFHDLIINQRH